MACSKNDPSVYDEWGVDDLCDGLMGVAIDDDVRGGGTSRGKKLPAPSSRRVKRTAFGKQIRRKKYKGYDSQE